MNFNVKKEADDYPVLVGKCCYIALMGNSIIKPIDDNVVPEIQFNFSKVDQIKSMNVNTKCGNLLQFKIYLFWQIFLIL